MPDGPFLWFLNRGTGFVLLVLLSASVALGVLATRGRAGGRVPRFLTQALHRDIALLTVALLAVHVASAVVDSYVDIRWWQAVSPVGGSYRRVWLGLGALALDALALVVVTSLLRHRLSYRGWHLVHLATYGAWTVAVAHGLGIGSDTTAGFGIAVYAGCVGLVAAAVLLRLGGLVLASARRARKPRRIAVSTPVRGGAR